MTNLKDTFYVIVDNKLNMQGGYNNAVNIYRSASHAKAYRTSRIKQAKRNAEYWGGDWIKKVKEIEAWEIIPVGLHKMMIDT